MGLKIALHGGSGRMGTLIGKLIEGRKELELHLCASSKTPKEELFKKVAESALIIDFTPKDVSLAFLRELQNRKIYRPLLTGTTGFSEEELKFFQVYSKLTPTLHENNMSTTVNLFFMMAEYLGKNLPENLFERKIREIHHTKKLDAPSGTALTLKKHLGGPCEIESVREGDEIGTHTLLFKSKDEEFSITHKALNRELFARGALEAALWLYRQPANFYSMRDYLENR